MLDNEISGDSSENDEEFPKGEKERNERSMKEILGMKDINHNVVDQPSGDKKCNKHKHDNII